MPVSGIPYAIGREKVFVALLSDATTVVGTSVLGIAAPPQVFATRANHIRSTERRDNCSTWRVLGNCVEGFLSP
jgi:hypothetical protein